MKNGWYKLEYKDNEWTDYWPPNDYIVYVENDTIVEKEDEWGDHKQKVNIPVTKEMKSHMAIMEFAGVGCA